MLGKKMSNNRRFPGESGKRPDRAGTRRLEAEERQVVYLAMSVEEKIAALNAKFGPDKGAAKVRAKLTKGSKQSTVPPQNLPSEDLLMQQLPPEVLAEIQALNEDSTGKKKIRAKERRALAKKNG